MNFIIKKETMNMKKIWVAVFLMGAMLGMFAGCSSDEGSDAAQETPTATSAEEETVAKSEPETTENEALQLGAIYSTSEMEITFNNVYLSDTCEVQTGSHSFNTTDASEGNTLVVVEASIKNLGKEAMALYSDTPFDVKVEYDNNYQYESNGYYIGEDEIAPLATKTECATVEIPDEVANGTAPLVAYVSIGSATYSYTIR